MITSSNHKHSVKLGNIFCYDVWIPLSICQEKLYGSIFSVWYTSEKVKQTYSLIELLLQMKSKIYGIIWYKSGCVINFGCHVNEQQISVIMHKKLCFVCNDTKLFIMNFIFFFIILKDKFECLMLIPGTFEYLKKLHKIR